MADARRAVADAIAAAAELREKAAALRLDVGRRRADAARRQVAEELAQLQEDETASSERALDFYVEAREAGPLRADRVRVGRGTSPPRKPVVCYGWRSPSTRASSRRASTRRGASGTRRPTCSAPPSASGEASKRVAEVAPGSRRAVGLYNPGSRRPLASLRASMARSWMVMAAPRLVDERARQGALRERNAV